MIKLVLVRKEASALADAYQKAMAKVVARARVVWVITLFFFLYTK